MVLLAALHGTLACVILCALLFVDETGVPMPLAPNELLLLIGGVLISTSALSPWIFVPAAFVSMFAGMLIGYGWSRLAGRRGVTALVRRLHAESVYERGQARLASAGPLGIAAARLAPGVRPWATLCCGAGGIPLRKFLLGALPALVLWEAILIILGRVVGLPAEHFLGHFERLILRGVVMVVLGIISYLGLRRLAREEAPAQYWRRLWIPLVILVTCGATASVAGGVLAIGRGLAHVHHTTWLDLLIVGGAAAMSAAVALVQNVGRRSKPLPTP